MLGRHYHRVYGYPWRWAFLAEIAWRIEHLGDGLRFRGEPLIWLWPINNWAYPWRKRFERAGTGHYPDWRHP